MGFEPTTPGLKVSSTPSAAVRRRPSRIWSAGFRAGSVHRRLPSYAQTAVSVAVNPVNRVGALRSHASSGPEVALMGSALPYFSDFGIFWSRRLLSTTGLAAGPSVQGFWIRERLLLTSSPFGAMLPVLGGPAAYAAADRPFAV